MDTIWYQAEKSLINHHFSFTFPKFHLLPKLHKQGPIKGRPIAGQVNWITTPVSIILDHRLSQHMYQFDCIIKNSEQIVNDMELLNMENTFSNYDCHFITADIESLYPNMDVTKLVRMIDSLDNTCTPLVEYVCKNSYIQYDGKIYQQTNGIPMGTNAAVTLANIYVGSLIDKFIDSRPEVFYYRRYIDDLFIVWKGDLTRFESFKIAVSRLLSIPINFDPPSRTMAKFLDIQINYDHYNKCVMTSVFQKSLNKYSYISPSSSHAQHMFTGFIKGELTRYARLSSTVFAYKHTKHLFYKRLVARGYSRKFLNSIFKKHRWIHRENDRTRPSIKVLPFIIPYSLRTNAKLIKDIVIDSANDIESYFTHSKVIVAYQRRRNIADLLCPSAISHEQSTLLRRGAFTYKRIGT
jgi:hypothetical protein